MSLLPQTVKLHPRPFQIETGSLKNLTGQSSTLAQKSQE
jgi:hypothetical protein